MCGEPPALVLGAICFFLIRGMAGQGIGGLTAIGKSNAKVYVETKTGVTYAFLLVAEVFWPVFVPIAILLAEPLEARRRFKLAAFVVGVPVAAYLLFGILTQPHPTAIAILGLIFFVGWIVAYQFYWETFISI